MSRYVHQIPFAAQGEFIWNRNTTHNGVAVRVGDRVASAGLTPVRLRQMYDARIIVPAPFGAADPPRYLNNGLGKAAKLAAEIAAEEAAAAKTKAKGDDVAPAAKPAPQRTRAARPAPAVASKKPSASKKSKRSRAA